MSIPISGVGGRRRGRSTGGPRTGDAIHKLGALLVAAAVVAACGNGPDALVPVETQLSQGATKLKPNEVVYVGFADAEFPVRPGVGEVQVERVEVVGVPEHVSVVDAVAAPVAPDNPVRGVAYADDLPSGIVPVDSVTLRSDSDDVRWQILVGASADQPGEYVTEGLVVHYTADGNEGQQRYDYTMKLIVLA